MRINIPHNLEAEEAILGTIVVYPGEFESLSGQLEPGDFYHAQHERIYRAMLDVAAKDMLPDAVALSDQGIDPSLLSDLASKVHTKELLQYYVRIVRDKSALRRFLVTLDKYRSAALNESQNASELITGALGAISDCYRSDLSIRCEFDLLREYVDEVRQIKSGAELPHLLGVPTGIRCIDSMLVYGGLPRGLVTTIGAKTSQGKSALAQAFKRAAAAAGNKVLVITLEDSAEANVRRDVSAESQIQNAQIQRRIVGDGEIQWFKYAVEKIEKYSKRVSYLDTPPDSIGELLSTASRWIRENGSDLVIIDYLQMLPADKAYGKEQQKLDFLFDEIVKFSRKQKNTATLLVTQMRRHEGRPQLDQLYHSAKLEQGSHTVMLIWRPEIKDSSWPPKRVGRDGKEREIDCRVVDIAKQKDGSTGIGIVGWDGKSVRFYDPLSMDADRYRKLIKE